ncbi:pilus assembly protein TadG-related protein [Thermoflexus sp.]|uniref:pilus assembly protein TadG-related protein n=1 Tax=Thermoflexus sp. TaxID=1969742 RepID=UPI0035E41EC9
MARDRSGQSLVLVALMLPALIGLAALAIDGNNAYAQRRRAQNAADVGALAGTRALWFAQHGVGDESAILQAIHQVVEAQGIPDTDDQPGDAANTNVQAFYYISETVRIPIPAGAVPPNARGVTVIVWNPFRSFLAAVIGHATLRVSAQAIAVYSPGWSSGEYALTALCKNENTNGPCYQNAMNLTGSDIYISGGIHSNSGLNLSNADPQQTSHVVLENGVCEYGGDAYGLNDAGLGCSGATPLSLSWLYTMNQFAPGGNYWNAAGQKVCLRPSSNQAVTLDPTAPYTPTLGDCTPNTLSTYRLVNEALYYVQGDVTLNIPSGWTTPITITIAATGRIDVNMKNCPDIDGDGSPDCSRLYPYTAMNLLFFSPVQDATSPVIQISSPNIFWNGLIYAPVGLVRMSSAGNIVTDAGAILAWRIDLSGSKISIRTQANLGPMGRPRMKLIR